MKRKIDLNCLNTRLVYNFSRYFATAAVESQNVKDWDGEERVKTPVRKASLPKSYF